MQFRIMKHMVKSLVWGTESSYENGILTINREMLSKTALEDTLGKYSIDIQMAYPGESVRIVHVTDVIKPSYKETGAAFPGWTRGEDRCGEGITHQMENICVTQCFCYPGIQEGILEMRAPGAMYSIFSKKINLVMTLTLLTKDLPKPDIARDLIIINTRAAEYIASVAANSGNGNLYGVDKEISETNLPKIGYAYFIQAQGPLRNVQILGQNCTSMKPQLLSPKMILDGAIVSGNYIIACQKNPTYLHQENPIIMHALERHGTELNFAGVIVSTESSSLDGKRENARQIAYIAKELGLNGILVTQEGGGHADVDLMFTYDACRDAGIHVVLLANEIAGPEGALPPLVSFSSNVNAIVSTGNNDEVIHLNAVDRAIGGDRILNGSFEATGELDTTLGIMYTATNQLGVSNMRTVEI